jgi:hypothetical protein
MNTISPKIIHSNRQGWTVFLRYASLIAFLAIPSAAFAQANLLINPGFETGNATGWGASNGSYSVVTGQAHSGTYAAQVNLYAQVGQTVTGLTPNTTYTCTGWFKVAVAGQAVYLIAENFGSASVSKSANTTTYTQVTVTFTTGATNTSAEILVYESGANAAYCDDLSLTGGTSNLLVNPGFEAGNATGWAASNGSYSVINSNVHSGAYAAQVNLDSQVAQTVAGLTPNTTYTCTGWLKVAVAGQGVYLIAQNFGGTAVSKSATTTAYTQVTITFTTGASNTSAEILVYESGAGAAYCDDLSLTSSGGGTGDATGTQANRIADCLQRFGVNTFSELNNNGYLWSWGGSQGSYDPATTGRAINYITGGSGLTINDREYHRDLDGTTALTPLQITWIRAVYQATGSPFTIAIAADGGQGDVPGIVSIVQDSVSSGLNYVKWAEGINEPNNNFGSGTTPIATTASVQTSLYQQIHAITPNVTVAAPSIIFGLPNPGAWLTSYLGTYQSTILANSDANNIHLYPPYSPNGAYSGSINGTLADVNAAYNTVLPGKPAINTEYHPTLYSNIHPSDRTYDAYWGPIDLLSSYADYNWQAVFWFALFDYNSVSMQCGLFATSDANPYPAASAYRALFQLTGDSGATKSSFTTGKINVTISGLPAAPTGAPHAGGRWTLFENSSNQYFLMLWNEQNTISATTTPVTVTFNSHNMRQVQEFNITSGSETPVQSPTNVHTMTVNLDTSLRLLRITY